MRLVRLFPAAALLFSASFAIAQTAPAPTNPLRPGTSRTTAPAAQTAPAPTTTAPAANEAATSTNKRQASSGQLASRERQKACGAEWKQKKAANQIPAGQKWPQFWSECSKRMKAQGR